MACAASVCATGQFPGKHAMKKVLLFLLAVLMIVASGCGDDAADGKPAGSSVPVTQTTEVPTTAPPPVFEWKFGTPQAHGMDAAVLEKMHNALQQDDDILSAVVVKNGVIIDEYYKEGKDETSQFPLHSCTKSFTSALIGIAIDEGLIDGVDVLISDYFPQIIGEPDRGDIKIRHLLEHTSGIEWPEWGSGASKWFAFVTSPNWVNYVLTRPMAAKPGNVFNYSTGNTHLLSAILDQAYGKAVPGARAVDFARDRLLAPLGIENYEFNTDPQGIMDGGSGLMMSARDSARFGQLLLQRGKWYDTPGGLARQIVPADWLAEATRAHAAGYNRYGKYGYQFYIKTFGGYDAFYAAGHGGQYIIVVPELELVTVINSWSLGNMYTPQTYFQDYVLKALAG